MVECIEKEAFIRYITEDVADNLLTKDEICGEVEAFPAVDSGKSKQASWVTDSDGIFVCSECEEPAPQRMMFHPKPFYWTCDVQLTNFCPNCGAELIPEKLRWADG